MKIRLAGAALVCQACLSSSAVVRLGATNADGAQAALLAKRDHQAISPTLRPASDAEFNHDYPRDYSPRLGEGKFGYPYPVLQDTDTYNKDFVKDENNDSGEWKAQFDFDNLRSQLQRDKARVQSTLQHRRSMKDAMDKLKVRESQAEGNSKAAERAADEAQQRVDESNKDLSDLTGSRDGKQDGGKIGNAVGDVNEEIKDVEGCEKRLREVQQKLKDLMEDREAREQAVAASEKEAANSKAAANSKYEQAKEGQYEKMDGDLLKSLEAKRRAHDEAVAAARMSEEEMKKLEAQIKIAAENLRRARHDQAAATPGGAIEMRVTPTPPEKSAAAGASTASLVLAIFISLRLFA